MIALLVEKTGKPKEEVERQLSELAQNIREVAESGGSFTIEAFGSFSWKGGELRFDPSEQLKTEINQRYAGMKPIELMEAFKETGAGVPVDAAADKPAASAPDAEPPPGTQPEEETDEKETGKRQEDAAALAAGAGGGEDAPGAPVSDEENGKKEAETGDKEPARPASATATSAGARKRPAAHYGANRGKRNSGKFVVAAVAVIAVFVTGWVLYQQGLFDGTAEQPQRVNIPADTSRQQDESSPAERTGDSALASGIAADSVEQNRMSTVSGNSDTPGPDAPATYGLKGTVNDGLEDAYTIVIHSFRLRSTVQGIADSLSRAGYRAILSEKVVNGENRWRLGLGQFATWQDALEAAKTLPPPYANDHFIDEI